MKATRGRVEKMFKHAQLETVKAWIIDPSNGSLPLHERIQRAIRTLILEGVLSHGKALPASRALATSLNVSRDTLKQPIPACMQKVLLSDKRAEEALSLPARDV